MKQALGVFLISILVYACTNSPKTSHQQHEHEHNGTLLHVSSDEGKEWNVFGVRITGKVLSAQTNGDYSVIVTETPPNGGPPRHVHQNEDELFYVLKGKYEFRCGDTVIQAHEGDLVHLPKGIPHNFVNVDTVTGITMNTITPGGFEQFFDDVAEMSKSTTLSRKQIDSIAGVYGVSFISK
ncbi:MAG: cupin domain-containing protein [Bacteroidia bacterium]|nr:cupin domain-containing protein [Bacteroidia bacterium]